MKSKLTIAFLVIAAVVVGFFLGRWQFAHNVATVMAKFQISDVHRATAAFSHVASVLQAIHTGNTNEAIQTLEEDLVMNLEQIAVVAAATPVSQRDKQWVSRIQWFRQYRAEHPDKTTLDETVSNVLSLVETNQ